MDLGGLDESFMRVLLDAMSALQDRKCDCIFVTKREDYLLIKVVPQAITLVLRWTGVFCFYHE